MREASAQEAIQSVIQYQLNNVWTAIPAVIVAVRSLEQQLVDVQPVVNQKLKDGTINERPPILGVPLIYPASSTSAFTFPVSVGDTVLCVFSMRAIETFKAGVGRPTTPLNAAKFDKKDAMAIPGLFPIANAINNPSKHSLSHSTTDAVISHNLGTNKEVEIRLKDDGSLNITTSNQPVNVIASDVTVLAQNITWQATNMTVNVTTTTFNGAIIQNGNYTGTGIQTFNGIQFSSHKHTGVTTGSGTSGGPTN